MSKITVILTSAYDDGKTVKGPGDTVSMEERQAKKLATLGMVQIPAPETDDVKTAKQAKGKKAKADAPAASGDNDPDAAAPSAADLDPDAMGQDEE